MLNSILSAMGVAATTPMGNRHQLRIQGYIRWKRLYDGFMIRKNRDGVGQWKPLRYNLARPVVNKSADFLAMKPITFTISDDDETTTVADKIWTESGGSSTFRENAGLGSILGDSCIMVAKEEGKTACLRWLDPSICYPDFDQHDYTIMRALTIAYEVIKEDGKTGKYMEIWKDGTVTYKLDDKITGTDTYDQKLYGGVPAVWIRNLGVKGEIFGRSDIQPIAELVEEFDHLSEKQGRVVDYYASPNLYAKGVTKKQLEMTKGERTMYFLPADGDIGFIEWKGSPPGVDTQIMRVRETISEVSEVPQIAFSKMEGASLGSLSGVAMRILYGPLMAKTERNRMTWGPAMEKAMWMALIAEGIRDVDLSMISIKWQDPLPQNEVEEWQVAGEKNALGVSKRQVLREAGYTDDEIDQFEKEKSEEQEALGTELLKGFNAGTDPNNPYPKGNPAPAPKKSGQ